ncbi:type I DNA topoisomerase [Candidatus Microgenomates bacterium]|nr:type I DNA topoisomerase [Candidatus Microgenomates bacterium]
MGDMGKNLVIVESPAKAKTISQYLGKDYTVKSSFGHVRDLPKKELGVDVKRDFQPKYIVSAGKEKVIRELKAATKLADVVWLATDEDREGEAIAWHLKEALGLKPEATRRIVFHEITKSAIMAAVAQPRAIDEHLVDAQQARRILDRLVGYELSPVLWRKIRTGLSAGRVQSVAVRLVVERERAIRAFQPLASFELIATLQTDSKSSFTAKLTESLTEGTAAQSLLKTMAEAKFQVADLIQRPVTKNPPKPMTTSTLQQIASRLLGFSVRQTMVVAQQLYEAGYITYMRTDSLSLADSALKQAAAVIKTQVGSRYVDTRRYATTSRLAQEAHEAIRPTDFTRTSVAGDANLSRLYQLIWERTLASQMAGAQIEKTEVKIEFDAKSAQLEARGEVVKFDGFLRVYNREARAAGNLLPALAKGQILTLVEARAAQVYSRPQPRYSEASLVRKLEMLGIGRPSTYAPTIATIQDRGYVVKTDNPGQPLAVAIYSWRDGRFSQSSDQQFVGRDQGKLTPTDIGEVVNDFLVKYVPDIVDYQFTARAEAEFDGVAAGKLQWPKVLQAFYSAFHPQVEKATAASRQEASQMRQLGTDPKTGRPVFARVARYGPIVQLGTAEDEAKPQFAPIPKDWRFDTIELTQALKLLELPRLVGKMADGRDITATVGPYGPYVKAGSIAASLGKIDPHSVAETAARRLIIDKETALASKTIKEFPGSDIKVLNGRYGPYVNQGRHNAPVPKDVDPAQLELGQAKKLLAAPPKRGKPSRRHRS